MVKFAGQQAARDGSFSPLLILFMVKSSYTTSMDNPSFSPLLILFMVKSRLKAIFQALVLVPC